MRVGGNTAALKVVSSRAPKLSDELVTTQPVGAGGLIGAFAAVGSHSILIKTEALATGDGHPHSATPALRRISAAGRRLQQIDR